MKHIWILGLITISLCPISLRAETDQSITAQPPGLDFKIDVHPQEFSRKVTFKAKNLFAHADYLASDECEGRQAGSPGQARARSYIVKQLNKSGFDEVKHYPFEFVADMKLGGNTALSASHTHANVGEKNIFNRPMKSGNPFPTFVYELHEDFLPLKISKAGTIANADLVFAGYGISAPDKGYDDYKDLDVAGKLVLVIRSEPESRAGRRIGVEKADPHDSFSVYSDLFYKASSARDKGALGLVIVNGIRGMSESERKVLDKLQHGSGRPACGIPLIQVVPDLADDWLKSTGKNIASLQEAIDESLTPQSFLVPGINISANVNIVREHTTDENVAVVLQGNDPVLRDEILVIGAHYDHLGRGSEFSLADKNEMGQIHRGADDNASGVSSLLELAAALRKNRDALKRSVWIIFFGAEELGTLGSIHFTQSPPPEFSLKNTCAMLNLDMVGRCRERKVMVYGTATGTGFDSILKLANQDLNLDLKPGADGFGGSDQTPFVTNSVPVLFFFTGSHKDYHRPSDTVDKLNVVDQTLITALTYNVAAALINAPERPKFVKVDVPKMSGGVGGVGLGTLPDYSFEGKGLRIIGVREKSPADRAGLKAGDIITKLGNRTIENIYDYMNALKQSVAGIETMATIKRDGSDLEIKVTPEKR